MNNNQGKNKNNSTSDVLMLKKNVVNCGGLTTQLNYEKKEKEQQTRAGLIRSRRSIRRFDCAATLLRVAVSSEQLLRSQEIRAQTTL